ncbi:UDP-N-acetylmuramoyl-L-alanine--D-glutamate ligase [Candidatus Peregrinibacteria bacterium]|nr:UDP-N-acetylmuramoyl-L-alanine--D-glutamate ligase [Candidatus Peregrinibacteria bacterium]
MHLKELRGKKICILGFGREGQATLRALEKYAPNSNITIADQNPELPLGHELAVRGPAFGSEAQARREALRPEREAEWRIKNYEYQCGEHYVKNLDHFDVIIKSPGIPPSALLTTNYKLPACRTGRLTTPTQIFLDSIADTGATVIGITGSKGKSTTASLIYEIFNFQFSIFNSKTAFLIGNIGEPALNYLQDANEKAVFVMELSSYQLMDLTVSPHIAVITSFFPEHLDYHGSLEAYREAKEHITAYQTENDVVFYPSKIPSPHPALSPWKGERVERAAASEGEGAYEIALQSSGKKISFSEEDAPVTIEETKLIGRHNLRNIAAAWKVAEYLGIPRATAVQAIREFHPLPHRLQSLGIHHGVEWVDDAISTTPESTIAAIDALGDRVATIILGGLDRGYDFTKLAKRIAHSSIRTIILFPGSGPRIREAIEKAKANVTLIDAHSMEEAVEIAKINSQFSIRPPVQGPRTHQGLERRAHGREAILNSPVRGPEPLRAEWQFPAVLLSTASPSYNMFKNFEEKGNRFQKAISSSRCEAGQA